jgi:hypothetical protein
MYWEMLALLTIVALVTVICLGLIAAGSRQVRLSRQRRAALRRWIQSEVTVAHGQGRPSGVTVGSHS